jgi:hypothetical protein
MISLIPKSEFASRKRDRMLDYQSYEPEAEDLIKRVPNAEKKLRDPKWLAGKDEAALLRLTQARTEYALNLLTLSYTAGEDLQALRDFYPAVLDYFEEYALYSEAFNRTPEGLRNPGAHFAMADVDFDRINRLLSFALLLGWQQFVPRVMALADYNNPVRDGMLERIASLYMERSKPLPDECTRHLPYYKTLAIFNAGKEERPILMREYLEDWYEASRREPYYESHSKVTFFLGYWAWEAAAITAALQIDDRTYRDMEFYPREMAAYAGHPVAQASGSGAPASDLRAKAGEPCPESGIWESIGIPVQRASYTKDQVMQDLGSPYGLTVWRRIDV